MKPRKACPLTVCSTPSGTTLKSKDRKLSGPARSSADAVERGYLAPDTCRVKSMEPSWVSAWPPRAWRASRDMAADRRKKSHARPPDSALQPGRPSPRETGL